MSTWFALNPRATLLMVMLIAVAGLGALHTLARQEDPTLVDRFGTVTTLFPGASAERVEALITEPLEEALLELDEIGNLISRTQAGVSVIILDVREEIGAGPDVDQAWTLIRANVERATASLPEGASEPIVDRQYTGAATMIVSLSWDDGSEDALGPLTRLARELEQRFQSSGGVDRTILYGGAEEEIRVLADADELAALGISTADLAGTLAAADAKTPAGQVRGDALNLGVELAGEFEGVGRVRDVAVLSRTDGRVVRVGDIAEVVKDVRTPPSSVALANGRRAVFLAVFAQRNQRLDLWASSARDMVEEFAAETPSGLTVDIAFEQNEYVERRLNNLAKNLVASALIVFVVLFVMMGWRAALIVGSALPLTTLLVLSLLNLKGEPLHQMSVTGLVISLGLLIDNAIVMVDEYRIRRGHGASQLEAVRTSVRHLFVPLLASTATTMLAFAPLAFMPGTVGEFISMIGYSVIFAVGSSFLLAIAIVPAFAAWFDSDDEAGRSGSWLRNGVSFPPLTRAFRFTVRQLARFPAMGFVLGVAAPLAGFVLAATLPLQLFPPTDRDMFQVELALPTTASIYETRREVERASELIASYSDVESFGWVMGEAAPRVYYNVLGNRSSEPSYASGWVRTESSDATQRIVNDLQQRARQEFPNAQFLALPFEQGPPVPAPIEMVIVGPDLSILDELADEARLILSDTAHVTYTSAGLALGAPVAKVQADEAAARLAGLRLSDLAGLVRSDLDGVSGGSVLEGVEELPVRVILADDARSSLDAVRGKTLPGLPNATGLGAPLAAFGPVVLEPQVAVIQREAGRRTNPVRGFIDPFSFPAIANADFQKRLEAAGFFDRLPAGYHIETGGEAETRGDAVGNLLSTAAPLLVLVTGSLVLAFNSFRYAGVIAGVGVLSVGLALLGVRLFGEPLGMAAIMGAMGLVGLAINGSIVVLSALRADAEATEGDPDAIADVTVEAARHIIATTVTTVGGFMPLILAGDSFWLPMAAAIAGGVAGSALLALFFIPAVHAAMARGEKRRRDRKAMRTGTLATAQ